MESPKIAPAEEEQSSTDIDDLHYSLQAEQESTQKRTFTSWINSQLQKHSPCSLILDLYTDIGKGHVLLDLLEVLSEQQLPREKGFNTFQCRSNIENALTFLKNRSIKLINIHVADIIEGKPSIVLGLIWTIILHFHIEELAWTLAGGYGHPSVETPGATDDSSPTESPPAKRNAKARERWKMSAKKALLLWVKEQCARHGSVSIADFKSSWRNGLAFLAIIHALRPDLVDMEKAKGRSNKENLNEAFQLAEKELNIPRLLEPEDVDVANPDEKSIMTYVAQFLQYFKSLPAAEDEMQGKVNETLSWLEAQEKKLTELLTETDNAPFYEKFQELLSFMETFDEEKKAFLPVLASKRKPLEQSEDHLKMREAWDNLTTQMNEWKEKLDRLLPPPLDTIESWLQDVEHQLAEDVPDSHNRCKVMAVLEGRMRALQSLMECFEQHLETLLSFKNGDKADMPLVPSRKLEEMRRRFSNIQLTDFSILVEYYQLFCTTILEELISKLNIWHTKYGTKEMVESLLSDWHDFIEEKGFIGQLESAFQICEEKKDRIISTSVLGADPEDINKLFKMVESQISRCKEYIYNVNETLQKNLSSWAIYTTNIRLLKAWLEKTRKEHPKKVPTETLAAWNSRHGSLNEAGNFLIECSNEEVGTVVSAELKKLNRKWAKLIKKTQFEMKLLRMQQEEMCLMPDNNGNVDSPTVKGEIDMFGHRVNVSDEAHASHFESMKTFPFTPCSDSLAPEVLLSEQEVKLNFEDTHKKLDTIVLKAVELLGHETGLERPVSKYEKAFSILDTSILGEFLKAAEQLKDISAAHEKAVVEEKTKDVCERWEAVRREIISYIQLKIEIESGKLNKIFSKLDKQIIKEKKLLKAGKTKGLLEEHEDMFSQQGSMGKLNACLQAMKMMSEKMAMEDTATKMLVAEYEQKKEDVQRRASAVYSALVSRACEDLSPKRGGLTLASSANGERASSLHPYEFSAQKGPSGISGINLEADEKLQNGGHRAKKYRKDGSLALEGLTESCDKTRHKLKLHLSSIRENVAPAFTADIKDAACLQNKLHELEALESKGESMAAMLENCSGETKKPDTSEQSQEELLREWNELQLALNKRMESLKAVLALVLPVENEWIQLCSSEEQLRKRDIPQCVLWNMDLPHKKVKKMQVSIANCIEWCNQQEQSNPTEGKVDPADWQAASALISEYKMQLEELGHKIQTTEAVLQDLETFLTFLRHDSGAAEVSDPLSHPPQLTEGLVQQEVLKIQKEARSLDDRLKRARIRLEDPDSGKKVSCKELAAALCSKEIPAVDSAEKQEVVQTQDVQEEFSLKNSEFYKNIQDIHDKICKIGLRDPTIPAVQQRLKLLTELRQKLDCHAVDMKSLNEMASQLSQFTKAEHEELKHQWRLTEDLWKETKLSIAEKLEHCGQVMELLKQYQSCKNCLMRIIRKQEHALSQQVSYMGKANLQRITAKINMAKQEFNSHSEDVDRINQICKNLQFQLNKIKSFEEPPFENEANAIVDRWLDINERTENYCDNLGRALALWDKLLNLSGLMDEWSNAELKKLEDDSLTEKELAELEAGLEYQEKNIEEFDTKGDEIQHLLNGSEPPLELQVIKSSLLNKMELIRQHLPNKSIPTELNGNTAELKGDLDLAKTQIGMTESLLKALSPSDTLEIFTKLEDLHQKILQQKRHVESLQKGPGYLNPEVTELKEQLKSVTDLFNSKKKIFQDHFTTLLNYQCKDFDDWFSSTQLSLEECFEPSETKEMLEEKIQRLRSFLSSEGKDSDIHEVKTLLSQVKHYLPRETVYQLSNWVRDKEVALQKVTSKCQTQEEKLRISLQWFARLEDDFGSLAEWLHLQELQEKQTEKSEFEHFYQTLLKKRESFDSFAWLTNSLRSSGFTCDEMVLESAQLVSRYKMLLGCVCKSLGVSQVLSAEEKNFEELAQSLFSWVQRVNELVLRLSSEESSSPLEEKLCQIKEIALLKEEGDAKLQNVAAVGEDVKSAGGSKNQAIQKMVSHVQNQWESTIHLVAQYLRHQEQLQHQREQYRRRENYARAALRDSETQKQEISLDLYLGSQEMDSQLINYLSLQEEAEDLTLLLNELARQHSSLGVFTDDSFTEESLMALQQLHESLVNRLESTAMLLEEHAEEHQRCKELMTHLRAILDELWDADDEEKKQVQQDTLCQIEDTLQGIIAVVEILKDKITTLEQMYIKDEMDAPHSIYKKNAKIKVGHVEQEAGNIFNDAFREDHSFSDDGQTQEKVDDIFFDVEEESTMDVLERGQEGKSGSAAEVLSQKNLLPGDKVFAEYAKMEKKVNEMMIWTSELDIVLVNDQLKEIEKLCAQLEKQRGEALSLSQGEHATGTGRSTELHSMASSRWDKLLQDLTAVKEAKQEQLHLVNNYQECFAAVQSSMKRLSAEKENLKTRGPMEDTVLLENIRKCLMSIKEERVLLNKLKAEQENLSRHLTKMDKALTQSQVDQVERWWKQMEDSLQRKQLCVAAEADQFKLFMNKAQALQKLLQQQHRLQTGLDAPRGEDCAHPVLIATELQTLKHSVSLLKRGVEMQMKRIWSDPGKRALESIINDLQNQVEELEQLTPKEDIQVIGNFPQMPEITKKIEEAILWARVSELHLDEKAALFPGELMSQIQSCQALISVAKEKEPAVMQLVDEARFIAPQLASKESSALGLLAHELQTCHQCLMLKLVQRAQQLELQFEKRQKLFADIEKVQSQLCKAEEISSLDAGESSVKSELVQWRVVSGKIPQEIQETEGLIDSNYKDPPQGLNIFEQLFLNDCLRSFRRRAKRALQLIQIKDSIVQNKIDTCENFSEKIMALQQDLSSLCLQCNELEINLKKFFPTNQEFKGEWSVLKERTLSFLERLTNLDKHKEIWEFLDLKWDASCLDELQSQLCKMKNYLEQRVKCFESFSTEYDRYQTVLSEAKAIVSNIQRNCDDLKDCSDATSETNLITEKVLSWRVQHARHLTQEALRWLDKNEALTASLKEAKMQEIKSLGAKIEGVSQMLQSKILAVQEKCQREQGLQGMLNDSLATLKQIQSEIQQPFLLDLEIQMIPCEKMYCKLLEDAAEAECLAVEDLLNRGSPEEKCSLLDILGTELGTLQNLRKQLKADISARMHAIDEDFETVRCYSEAVQRATDLLHQCEAILSTPELSLDELEKESVLLIPQKQEELEAAKTEVEALTSLLEKKVKQRASLQLQKTLGDLVAGSLIVREKAQERKSDLQRCLEKYEHFKKSKDMICANLNDVKKVLQKALGRIPVSYKESLEQSEKSKVQVSRLVSTEEDLMKLRQDSGHLSLMCREHDRVLISTIVSTLWLKWLHLLNAAKEWEGICEEQNQEWKSINEEMERETIILDNLQEELPENPKEKESPSKEELEEFLECANYYKESVEAEKLSLRLILQRLRSILGIPESPPGKIEDIPVVHEIQATQERIKELCEKVQKQKDAVQSEKEDRAKVKEEISTVKNSLQHALYLLCSIEGENLNEKAAKLEEIQKAISTQKQILEQIMEKLRIKYTDMYTIVPVEIEMHLEDCKETLKDLEEKVSNELLKNSPRYVTDKKIEDINKGLQAVENMLQQKSEDIEKAKEIQKRIWDLLDLWHYKMNELDSEVQDIVEQDPCQAQELLDRLMIPLQQYQQVSQLAERRTANLNRASSKMEECDELLKSTRVWLESTSDLLTGECKSNSAKTLKKHASELQMAFEDSEQKQSILSAIYPELEELSTLIETDGMVQELNNVNEQVKALQQKIMNTLPHVQHLADEVEAIESEVKKMEKEVDKIKAILSPSEDTLALSPEEHLKHGQVILTHIGPMQEALVDLQSFKENLRLPNTRMPPLCVFQRAKQLLKELKRLERITKEQNMLLEPIVKEVEANEQEIDFLKQLQFPKSDLGESSAEFPWPGEAASQKEGGEMDEIKQRIALLCQKKEDILMTMKNSLTELHQKQEQPELEDDILESQEPEESGDGAEWQTKKRGSVSLLPSLVEEAEDNSFHNPEVDADEPKAMHNTPDQQNNFLFFQRTRAGSDEEHLGNQIKGKPSTEVTNTPECLWRTVGDSKETVDPCRPDSDPVQVLHVCQAQVAELEMWLDQAKESLGSGAQTCQMQQTMEQRLAACQIMLSEIEQKVVCLLEDCKDRPASDSPSLQEEAETLSLKLRDVKLNLEKVQGMLQDKHAEEEISLQEKISENSLQHLCFDLSSIFPLITSNRPVLSRPNGLQHQQELLSELSEQSNLIDFIEVYVKKMQPQSGDSTVLESQPSHEAPVSENEPCVLTPKDQTGDKWQYLQEQLLYKKNLPHFEITKPQISTKINILPKGATSSVRTPTVEELKMYTAQLGNLSQEASVQIQENIAGDVSLSLDQKLFELLLAISRCLNNMEQMLSTSALTSEEAPMQQMLYETLSAELQKLHADIGDKKEDLLKSVTSAGGDPERFSQCFSNLQAWLQQTEAATASRSKCMKDDLDHYSNYQNEIRQLYDELIEKKSMLQQSLGATSSHGISVPLQNMDSYELELQNFETRAAKLRDHGERLHLPVALVHEVDKLEEVLDDLWRILRNKQRELRSPFISEQQYEALLQGLAVLIDLGKEKVIQVSNLKATSQTNLQFYLQNHKSFFCNLKTHMLLVQMCSQKVSPSVLQKREKSWKEMVEEVNSLEQQAVQHGACFERLLQDWTEFEDNYMSFCQKLEAISSEVPSVSLVEETEERLMERTQLLQQIKKNIEEEKAWYHQLVKEGKNLMELVNCPELESQIGKLEEQWASLSQKVGHELQRLDSLLKLLSSYNSESKDLNSWLALAQQSVSDWKEQSLNASQDLSTVRNNIQRLLEFTKEVDEESSLKSSVISTGNQLLLIKESDGAGLRSSLTEYEQKWGDLIAQLPGIQEKFHQLQMAKLPSHEAITELTAWMNHIDQQRRNEATVDLQSPVCQVKGLLKKYKEYLIEMNFKQWVVDYVNQSLLQMTTCDVESKRYERTAFAERLGEMNLQWHKLQGSLNEKIKELEHILESVAENESRAQSLGSWLKAQSRRLKEAEKPTSSLLAQDTAGVCKALEDELAAKFKDMDEMKQIYAPVKYSIEASGKTVLNVNSLAELRAKVANQVAQLKTSTQSVLEHWRIYDEVWGEIRLMLARALYSMEHSKPPVITFETIKNQVVNLQFLQNKTESNEEIWARLQAAVGNLKKLCDPLFLELIEQKHKKARTRWASINKEIEDQLQKAQTYLPLWESYVGLYAEVTAKLDKHEEQCNFLLVVNIPAGGTIDLLKEKTQDVKKLQLGLQNIKRRCLQVSELANKITQQVEPTAQLLLLEKLQPLQRVSRLEKMLQMKANEFQLGLLQLEGFENCLEKLENHIKGYTEEQDRLNQDDKDSDRLMSQMLGLTALSPEMEMLNEVSFRLPLSDVTAKRLQSLNWQWAQRTAMVLEQCSELKNIQADDKEFLQQCQNWVHFLERMKEGLKDNVAGTQERLKEQQREYEMLQAEISVHQQIFNCIVSKALQMLESGEAENRTEFISKLTMLKEQWQSIIRMAQKRKSKIDGLVKQWQKFTTSLQDLTKFLTDTNSFIAAMKSQDKYSLDQVRNLCHDFKNKQILLQRWQTRYSLTLDTGRKLLEVAAPEAEAAIQLEMSQLQENWNNTQLQVEKITKQLHSTIEIWENCERQVEEFGHNLQKLKAKIKNPLPVEHEELQGAKEHIKDLEQSLANWNQKAKELGTKKADLARYLLAEDVMVLKEQVQHLHRQWEELCLRVSLRKQEIEDRLNAWIVFNEKNKELCAWLVQMESKVLQSADISIEDMIDKLEKDCMEEINMFSENKLVHLKKMGDQLIKDSNKSRVAEIDEKLNKINDRWQHLFDVIGGRVKKLKETFTFIQQLDKNMSNLRTWLARIESELSKPVVYDICDDQEIQKRLAEQQDLQRDIEQHSAGVESVFSICEVLLHDSDACANETECDSIQQTTRSLDRRWRNICAMSMERRMKIEETWRLWQRFLEDYSRFEDWLKTAERTAAYPNSSEVSYTNAKEELKKFEAFQRQIHERLTQLELINKQYRRLARENRTDSASKLKQMVHEGNQRWDNLQRRVTAILRRLKHFTNQWEEFVGTKDSVLVWLTEMDLQLTNVEHFSESNFDDKMRQLNGFQQEIMLNTNKIDQIIESGEHLIQKSEPSDAVVIEEELEELLKYYQEVFGRVSRFHQRLVSWHPGLEDEKESSENEADREDARGIQSDLWHKKALQEVQPPQQSLCHLMPPAVSHERSGCETPVSVDSIPLEWDHTGDVGGSSSPEDEEEEPYYSALSDIEIPEHPEAYLKMTTKALRAASAGKSASETHTWHSPESPACRKHPYNQREMVRNVLANSRDTSTPYKPGYVKQLSTGSIDSVKEISGILASEETQGSQNLIGVAAVEKQPGAMERWELLQAQDLSNKLRMKQNLQQWQQLNSDLTNINTWLDTMEEELEELQEVEPANSIQVIEQRVKKLKDMLKAFDNYKALVLSVNLTSKDFKQADSTGSKELQNRLRRVNLRWEKANLLMGNWRKSLQEALMQCQDFHEMNQKLLLWLACAETRRHHAQVKDPNADPHTIQESRKELMQLEKELLEQQLQVNTLQEVSTYLLDKSDSSGEYIEADEKVHVIGKKLKQLLEGVSQDLKVSRGSQDISAFQPQTDEADSGRYHQLSEKLSTYRHEGDGRKTLETKSSSNIRMEDRDEAGPAGPKTLSFFYRVLRAALPLQLLFLLLLFLASLIPSSEEDYSCSQANNFARSFYPMLRYTNGPPPT